MKVNGKLHPPAALYPGKPARVNHRIKGGLGPRAYRGEEKTLFDLLEIEPRFLDRPTCSLESIYRLSIQDLAVKMITLF
jgi:hypothetical protein